MSWQAALTLAVPALVVIVGWFAAYRNNLRLAERSDRLQRVNRQLSDFYGPLLALESASTSTWQVFRSKYRPDVAGYWNEPSPTPEEAAAWRLWMSEVFMPLNRQMRDVIVQRIDLLEEVDVPRPLLQICAHVAAFEPLLKRWEEGDFTDNVTPLNFPAQEVHTYVADAFHRLKSLQRELLDQRNLGRA